MDWLVREGRKIGLPIGHNFEVYNGIPGLTKEEIDALIESKVIY
jgi:hypothetical protein